MSALGAEDLLGAMPYPAALIGPGERLAAVNHRAERLLGRGLVGRHYIAALRQPPLLETIEAVKRSGEPASAQYLGRNNHRDTTWAAHVATAGDSLLISFEDRTQAEEAGQMRRDFVANVSHEMKTPLTAMLGFIETLRGPARDDEAARDRFLGIMEREAQRMNRLVQDLLSLSRVEAAERVRPKEVVDLSAIVASTLHLLTDSASTAGAEVVYDRPGDPAWLAGDADQLRQVVANLAENAIKYGGRRVDVRLRREDPCADLRGPGLVLDVMDDGPGIDQLHLPRLSERFYRVDTHRSRAVGGTGLGLAIVKHIVSRHRGRFRISSEAGKGSTFTIVLPASPENDAT